MPIDPLKAIETAIKALGALKGKSRTEKLADLAEVAKILAEADAATDDPEIDSMIDSIASAAEAIARNMREKIKVP